MSGTKSGDLLSCGDRYRWSQSLSDVSVIINLPRASRAREMNITLNKNNINVQIKGVSDFKVDGTLFKSIKKEESTWHMEEDGRQVVLELTKESAEWWSCVCIGDPEIDTAKIEPATSKLSDLDPETRSMVEKMMLEQRQKQTAQLEKESKQKEILARLQEQNPNMDFSNVKFSD